MSARGVACRQVTCLPHYLFGDVLVLELGRQVEDGLHRKTLDVCREVKGLNVDCICCLWRILPLC